MMNTEGQLLMEISFAPIYRISSNSSGQMTYPEGEGAIRAYVNLCKEILQIEFLTLWAYANLW